VDYLTANNNIKGLYFALNFLTYWQFLIRFIDYSIVFSIAVVLWRLTFWTTLFIDTYADRMIFDIVRSPLFEPRRHGELQNRNITTERSLAGCGF